MTKIPESEYTYYWAGHDTELARAPGEMLTWASVYWGRELNQFWIDPLLDLSTKGSVMSREEALKYAGVEKFPDGPDQVRDELKHLIPK